MSSRTQGSLKQRLTRRGFLKATAGTAALGLLQAGGPTPAYAASASPAGPRRGGSLTLAKTAGIQDFNPMNLRPGHFAHQRALFSTLAHYDAQLQPQPELAEKWEFSSDGKSLSFKLRQGVKFHSGREFTAEDVKHTVEFASTSEWVTMRTLYQTIKKVETPDRYTAVLRFDTINPGVFDLLDTLYILDKENLKELPKSPIGTGPFKLERYIPNDRVEMVAFRDYWDRGKPYLDKFVIREIPDVSTLVINLESGAVDCIWQPTYRDVARLKESGGKFVVDMGAPGSNMYCLTIGCKTEPFTNEKVRQAIAWATDRARFCKTTLQGLVEPTCLMWPAHSWAYFKDLEDTIGYNLEKAKALLKEAGLEKGFETEIMSSSKQLFGLLDLAQILQADLRKIGVNAKIADTEPAIYNTRLQQKRDFGIATDSYGRASRDPGTLVTAAKSWYTDKEGGKTRYESAEWDQLRSDLQSTLDQGKRKAICRKLQEMALDECFTILIAPNQRPWVLGSYVKGFTYDMDNSPFVDEIWLDK